VILLDEGDVEIKSVGLGGTQEINVLADTDVVGPTF